MDVLAEFIKENKIFPFVIISLLSTSVTDMAELLADNIADSVISDSDSTNKKQQKNYLSLVKFIIMCAMMWFFIILLHFIQ